MGDQTATTPERGADGEPLNNVALPHLHDVDRDGCVDLVMARSLAVRVESPLVYRNDGSGRFQAMSPVPFAGSSRSFGGLAMPADVNGDTVVDFVVPHHNRGPDDRLSTADDWTTLVTLLNTTVLRVRGGRSLERGLPRRRFCEFEEVAPRARPASTPEMIRIPASHDELAPARGRGAVPPRRFGAEPDARRSARSRILGDMVETLTAIAAVIGAVGSVTAGIGVLIVNGKIDRLTGRVDALESTMQTVLTLIAGRPAAAAPPPSND